MWHSEKTCVWTVGEISVNLNGRKWKRVTGVLDTQTQNENMLLRWFRVVDDYRISGSELLKDHEECAPIFDRNLWQQRQKVILSHRKTRNTKFTLWKSQHYCETLKLRFSLLKIIKTSAPLLLIKSNTTHDNIHLFSLFDILRKNLLKSANDYSKYLDLHSYIFLLGFTWSIWQMSLQK